MVLRRLLSDYGKYWSNIYAIYFDPYSECEPNYKNIHGISFITQPFAKSGAYARSQLSHPSTFKVQDKDFSHCQLFSLFAWDPVSWPGNDFYLDNRVTDDGVKASATDTMKVLTGVEGSYCNLSNKYLPPKNYSNWEEVVIKNNLNLC